MTLAEHIERASRNTAETYEEGYNNGYEADKTDVYNQGYADGQKDRDMDIPPSIDDAYRRGYKDAEKKHNSDLDYKNGLEDGRMEAWECARKIMLNMADGGIGHDAFISIFGEDLFDYDVLKNLSASEAIAKIKEYEGRTTRTGHWIDDEFGSKCSCCGIYTHLDKFDRPMKFKYCSMCGARMESEDKE